MATVSLWGQKLTYENIHKITLLSDCLHVYNSNNNIIVTIYKKALSKIWFERCCLNILCGLDDGMKVEIINEINIKKETKKLRFSFLLFKRNVIKKQQKWR